MTDDDEDPFNEQRARFEAAYDAGEMGGPYRDEAFIRDAVMVFCIETVRLGKGDTAQQKAAMAIASRLMAIPDMEKEWRVSFPYVFMNKEDTLTEGEVKRRGVAMQVRALVRDGIKVTHAIAQVAARLYVSPQKVTKDYYDWLPSLQRFEQWAKRSNPDG